MPPPNDPTEAPRPGALGGRWGGWARLAGIAPGERLTLALSGGADSVALLRAVAGARPRPVVRAVHVEHGLRGAAGRADEEFCRRLCAELGVELVVRRARLDPASPNLEARARARRYGLLLAEARASGHLTLLTGHHADDELETLLMRWMRGTTLEGLRGARGELWIHGAEPGADPLEASAEALAPVRVVRPLRGLRRAEVRELLQRAGVEWREDESNTDPRFTRSRVRGGLLPSLERACGPRVRERLTEFARAVERLEQQMARSTAHLEWAPPAHATARRAAPGLGGRLSRGELMGLPAALLRRALWRLLSEGTGQAIGRTALEQLMGDLRSARCGRRSLPGDWTLWLRPGELELLPPASADAEASAAGFGGDLIVGGALCLPDGRRLRAERASSADSVSRAALRVELDADRASGPLRVRFPQPGDRFHPLGAPGSRPLRRFLADCGVPREERANVPLVLHGDEIIWVAGLRPAERWRVGPGTAVRLVLELQSAAALATRAVG